MATVLSLSSNLPALRRVFSRAGPVFKKHPSCEAGCPRRQQGISHVHKCLVLFLSAPLPPSAPLYLILHAVPFHVFCPLGSLASLLSTIPSISFHERHMLAHISFCQKGDSAGWNSFLQQLAPIWKLLFLLAAVSLMLGPVDLTSDAPELSHIPGSERTCSSHICF